MSSVGDGCITKGYRYVAFRLLVVQLLSSVSNIYNIKYNCLFFYFRLTSIQIGLLLSITSCGKLMHVFSTDIGLHFF